MPKTINKSKPEQPPVPTTEMLAVDDISLDGDTQPRVALKQSLVDEYAELYTAGNNFHP